MFFAWHCLGATFDKMQAVRAQFVEKEKVMASTVVTGTEQLVAPAIDYRLILAIVGTLALCLTGVVLALQAPPLTDVWILPMCR